MMRKHSRPTWLGLYSWWGALDHICALTAAGEVEVLGKEWQWSGLAAE